MEVAATVPLRDAHDLSLSYTPGVARVCEAIVADPEAAHEYTWVSNTVAVVTDGTAVLGLGNIGPAASMPVMEGKAVLFKQFGGVDAIPVALDTTDVDEIVETVVRLAPTFGGINLEDISSPRCFEIERRLIERLDIPVFHDDQHGTAVVVLAALLNAVRLTDRELDDLQGGHLRGRRRRSRHHQDPACRRASARSPSSTARASSTRAAATSPRSSSGWPSRRPTGPSPARCLTRSTAPTCSSASPAAPIPEDAIAAMAPDAIVFALANPNPEVHPDVAAPPRARRRHRALGLPEPDQQRARVPRHLPRRPRRPRHAASPRR